MTTSRYPLPHKSHDVVDDINNLRTTFAEIDSNICTTQNEINEISNTVTTLKNKTVHVDFELKNPEIQSIAANRYLVVNPEGDGFECLDGGGDPGGETEQCSVKRTDENFDTAWGDLLDVSKNGMTVQENVETSEGNQTHIFVDEIEVTETQLPKAELTNQQTEVDFDLETNESITLRDDIESVVDEVQVATNQNLGLVKIGSLFQSDKTESKSALKIPHGMKPANAVTRNQNNNFSITINANKNDSSEVIANKVINRVQDYSRTFLYDEVTEAI